MMLWPNVRDPFFQRAMEKQPKIMKTDIKKEDGNYVMEMELPGFDKSDIDVQLRDGYLTITAEQSEEKNSEEGYIRRERVTGTYARQFYIGDTVSPEDVKADFNNGVLTMTFPEKKTEDKSTQINVN